ncbi:hypothetical protein ACT9T1_07660 [Staphylococcus xylosus]|nr:hypothetical protein [Staphylococcus xylosus]MCE4993578.1 hypothetical protein [Staphylococcus xylosus]MDO5514562.1 hypothetical protein [Staphylococcus xylosus]MEB8146830.1 hypothetical protein [Staphylococcus xylosus]
MVKSDLSTIKEYLEHITRTIKHEDIIAFDNHPFAYKILDELSNYDIKISVISYSTDIIKYVSRYTNFNIIVPNGVVDSAFHIIVGSDVVQTFSKYRIRYYFITVPYIQDNDLYQTIPAIADIQKMLNNNANDIFLLNRPDVLDNHSSHDYTLVGSF